MNDPIKKLMEENKKLYLLLDQMKCNAMEHDMRNNTCPLKMQTFIMKALEPKKCKECGK